MPEKTQAKPEHNELMVRLIELVAVGRPEAVSPEQLSDTEYKLFDTWAGPCVLRLFPEQGNLKVLLPTRSEEGLRLALAAPIRRQGLRIQSSFDSKAWIIDVKPDDPYPYLKAVAKALWPSS